MADRAITPSQTVGPFFAYCLTPGQYDFRAVFGPDLVTEDAAGRRITIGGQVLDGDGAPVPDAMLELWQADGEGRYPGHAEALSNSRFQNSRFQNSQFHGFGRSPCDGEGRFAFHTVKPGSVRGPDGAVHAPHINVNVFARGLLRQLVTRIYFEDEPANAADPVLALVPAQWRHTLVARRDGDGHFRFDIRLRGEDETVFFDA